jgi:hypothetical protein
LVLASGPTDYHIIQVSKILKYEIISPAGSATKSSGSDPSSKEKEKEKEKERLAKLKEERLVKPPGVSTTGHRIFLMLDKTYANIILYLPVSQAISAVTYRSIKAD